VLRSGIADPTAFEVADRAVRALAPAALDRAGHSEAASRIRALPALATSDDGRTTMPALERIARATAAPSDLVRFCSQVAGAAIRLGMPGGAEQGEVQLLAAVVRLAHASVRAGLPPGDAVQLLA
jgi:hypothetical protein